LLQYVGKADGERDRTPQVIVTPAIYLAMIQAKELSLVRRFWRFT
jgi:hypothetical protein